MFQTDVLTRILDFIGIFSKDITRVNEKKTKYAIKTFRVKNFSAKPNFF